MTRTNWDVIEVADLTLRSIDQFADFRNEIKTRAAEGIRTGLVHVPVGWKRSHNSWHLSIVEAFQDSSIGIPNGKAAISTKLAIIRNPDYFETQHALPVPIDTEKALVLISERHFERGSLNLDLEAVLQHVKSALNVEPFFAASTPRVWKAVERSLPEEGAAAGVWHPVIHTRPKVPTNPNYGTPRLGSHRSLGRIAWPISPRTMRQVFPTTEDYSVRILGDISDARKVLQANPVRWQVFDPKKVHAEDFLACVDYWISWPTEAAGFDLAAAVSAMSQGCTLVLPLHLQGILSEGVFHTEARDVRRLINTLHVKGLDERVELAKKSAEASGAFSAEAHLSRLSRFGVKRRDTSVERPRDRRRTRGTLPILVTPPRVGFITSNGAGMGHLTRVLGIARAGVGNFESLVLSMSKGVGVAGNFHVPFEYIPYAAAMNADPRRWNEYLRQRVVDAIKRFRLDIVGFDGTWPYRGFIDATTECGVERLWVRRGMWKPHITPEQLRNAQYFDLILEPGEVASAYDVGATTKVSDAIQVAPITLLNRDEMLSRSEARRQLGLPAEGNICLITLGAGNINDTEGILAMVLESVRTLSERWMVVLSRAPISTEDLPRDVKVIDTFPLARYAKAFDFAVSAAGYNSYHEWIAARLPTIWVPNMATRTDDQDARARYAEDKGFGLRIGNEDPKLIREAIMRLAESDVRTAMQDRMRLFEDFNGASEAVKTVRTFLTTGI